LLSEPSVAALDEGIVHGITQRPGDLAPWMPCGCAQPVDWIQSAIAEPISSGESSWMK
jgi:hypothetical protein